MGAGPLSSLASPVGTAWSAASDELLAESAIDHRIAYVELYHRYANSVGSYFAWRFGHSSAEDLASETFLRSLNNLQRFDVRRSWKAWLFGIARHVASEYSRQRAHEAMTGDGERPLVDHSARLEDMVISAERVVFARSLVATLPSADQQLLALRFWNGMSYREIAAVVGASEGATRVRVHRALRRLRQRMATP